MKLSVAVVDDLKTDRETLVRDLHALIVQIPEQELVCRCYDSAEAFLADAPEVRLVFLDICMGGMNGIELARNLRSLDEKLLIVFLSTSSDFAFDAFPIHPFDYLIKPYSRERLEHVIREALRVLHVSEPKVAVRVARAVHNIPLGKLVSAVSQGHSVDLRLTGGETLRSIMNFSEIEQLLAPHPRFLLVNRGVLVNMDHVLTLEGDSLLMQDGSRFALRTRNRAELVARFSQYQIARLKGGLS